MALRPRTAVAIALASLVGLVEFCWPLVIGARSSVAHGTDAPWLFAVLLVLVLAVVLAEVAEGGMDAKAVALLGVLAAIGAALRPLGAGTAGIETLWFLLVLGGRVLGRGFGFVLGALMLFASALLTAGVGPWLPFQMLGAAWVGFGAGCLPARLRGAWEVGMLAAYGAVAGLLYGLLLDLSFWPFLATNGPLAYLPGAPVGTNLHRFIAFDLATSLGFDIPRAVTNAVLIAVTASPVLLALRRAARRAAFEAPGRFVDPLPASGPLPVTGSPPTGGPRP